MELLTKQQELRPQSEACTGIGRTFSFIRNTNCFISDQAQPLYFHGPWVGTVLTGTSGALVLWRDHQPLSGDGPVVALGGVQSFFHPRLQILSGDEVFCVLLLEKMKVKSESEVAQSCLTFSDPMDCSLSGSSVHGIFQARVLEWGAMCNSQ